MQLVKESQQISSLTIKNNDQPVLIEVSSGDSAIRYLARFVSGAKDDEYFVFIEKSSMLFTAVMLNQTLMVTADFDGETYGAKLSSYLTNQAKSERERFLLTILSKKSVAVGVSAGFNLIT